VKRSGRRRVALALVLATASVAPAAAAPAATVPLELRAPRVLATGLPIPLRGSGAAPGERVRIEVRLEGGWRRLAAARAGAAGRFARTVRPHRVRGRYVLRAVTAAGLASRPVRVRARPVLLAAVGDVNLGDGPGELIAAHGPRYPWTGTARVLRSADIAFGNLECAVSTRGAPVPKQFNFRGSPPALQAMADFAGFDVLNLANNHTGDYGTQALLDTVGNVRRFGMKAVGAGGSLRSAGEPRVVTRLGLKIAFVGFSNLLPASFYAGLDRAGTQPATPELIAAGVKAAGRKADVVVATFHWGVERSTTENARQVAFAQTALAAGADAVIGAHPHVLQPIRRAGPHRLVAYSLGNFVFGASSSATARTGILRVKLSARGVEAHRLQPATIRAARPELR
jgi:poly-gamma-glutamate capsule biosynthesis protein CapA/YwtB (metallophosphatase superfamily)